MNCSGDFQKELAAVEAKRMATLESKLSAIELSFREHQEKQTKENALLQIENRKLVKKVDELEGQLQQWTRLQRSLALRNGWLNLYAVVYITCWNISF